MRKKIMTYPAKLLATLALAVGSWSVHVACGGPYYQPKVPEKMRKNE